MSDERPSALERAFEGAARRLGGQLHPLQVIQRAQAAFESAIRDGLAPNLVRISLHPFDYERFAPAMDDLRQEIAGALLEAERRRGARRIGELRITMVRSGSAAEGSPAIDLSFRDTRHRDPAPPAGATRAIQRLQGVRLLVDGEPIELTHVPFTIGRAADNDLVLASMAVSKHHAEITRDPAGTLVIHDMESRNGLVVDGQRRQDIHLTPGTVVLIGDVIVSIGATP